MLQRIDSGGLLLPYRDPRISSRDGCVQALFSPVSIYYLVLRCRNLTTYFIFLPRIMLFWKLEAVGVTKILPSDGELRYSHCDSAGRHHVEASHDAFRKERRTRNKKSATMKHYLDLLQQTIRENWDEPALSDYRGATLSFGDLAREICRMHILFEEAGISEGDKIALCGRNSARWAVTYFAILAYKAVAVPILSDFTPSSVAALTLHSDARLLILDRHIWKGMDQTSRLSLPDVMALDNGEVLRSASGLLPVALSRVDRLYEEQYRQGVCPGDVHFDTSTLDELCIISYTSGTSGSPKGTMLSARSISSNVAFARRLIPTRRGWRVLSILPLAHLYGLMFELMYPMLSGCRVTFLGAAPTPSVLMEALREVRPYMQLVVPLILEKIFRNKVFPALKREPARTLMRIPVVREVVFQNVRNGIIESFGGKIRHFIAGGAGINPEVERFMRRIKLPYTVGYGMTECGPLICYSDWHSFAEGSCGRVVDRMELRIDSSDPEHEAGEIQVRGDNVMLGYYKNTEATDAAFTEDRWLRTGDMGVVDADGNLYIRGRCKSMILGPSGQNIYPEEIEERLNAMPLVAESLVVGRRNGIVALVVADVDASRRTGDAEVERVMAENLKALNATLPAYSRVASIELRAEEFEKPPKQSIKRYLYE